MNYFVTGGTGFIGRFLVPKLLDRGGKVFMLVRPGSMGKIDELRALWGVSDGQLIAVSGDLLKPRLGVAKKDMDALTGKINHFFHLAAVYDMEADAESQIKANVQGTRHALACAKAMQAGCFQHISSVAAAGLYDGTFSEDMFDEAEGLDHPYFRTKHDAEKVVRAEKTMPWRIYRPGMVVGDSRTGEMDKVDGPYYFFDSIRRISKTVPSWVPAIMVKGGELNIVPVDFVVNSLDYLAHLPRHDRETFHLTEPEGTSVGELIQLLLKTAHGPKTLIWDNGVVKNLGKAIPVNQLLKLGTDNVLTKQLMKQLGVPADLLKFVSYPTHFDSTRTASLLVKGGISCPAPEEYFDAIWSYWEQHLASGKTSGAGLNMDNTVKKLLGRSNSQRLRKEVEGKVVVVTGATSGIGLDCATKLAQAGATVILAARTPEKLDEEVKKLRKAGGDVYAYPCDISDMADCDKFVATVLKNHDHVDVLINNAGRSIRRSVKYSFDRFHDYERTMQLNYFGALRLILGFSPKMLERKTGQIVNISSIGVLASPPRFSAYVASKAALDAFSVCAAAEFADSNVRFTTINMPLVRTPMIAPTKLYDAFPTLSPDQAANLVMNSIVDKPKRVATGMGLAGAVSQAIAPNVTEFFLNQAYHLFPDSAASRGLTPEEAAAEKAVAPTSPLGLARKMFSQTLRGYHW